GVWAERFHPRDPAPRRCGRAAAAFRADADLQQRQTRLCRLQRHQPADARSRRRRDRADRLANRRCRHDRQPAPAGRCRAALLRLGSACAALRHTQALWARHPRARRSAHRGLGAEDVICRHHQGHAGTRRRHDARSYARRLGRCLVRRALRQPAADSGVDEKAAFDHAAEGLSLGRRDARDCRLRRRGPVRTRALCRRRTFLRADRGRLRGRQDGVQRPDGVSEQGGEEVAGVGWAKARAQPLHACRTLVRRAHQDFVHIVISMVGTAHERPWCAATQCQRLCPPYASGLREKEVGRVLMRSIAGFFILAIAIACGTSAHAQTYPARPINMIVPFPPGGNTDIMARALQNEMAKALGRTVVIINKGGAAGTLGLIDLARAAPDGYAVALTPNNPLPAQPHLQKLPYGMDSFRFICLTYYAPYVLIAGPQAPLKTFDEFVRFAKAKSENLIYGHPGLASQPHLGMLA